MQLEHKCPDASHAATAPGPRHAQSPGVRNRDLAASRAGLQPGCHPAGTRRRRGAGQYQHRPSGSAARRTCDIGRVRYPSHAPKQRCCSNPASSGAALATRRACPCPRSLGGVHGPRGGQGLDGDLHHQPAASSDGRSDEARTMRGSERREAPGLRAASPPGRRLAGRGQVHRRTRRAGPRAGERSDSSGRCPRTCDTSSRCRLNLTHPEVNAEDLR